MSSETPWFIALCLGHIHHVQPQYHRHRQHQQFRQQVEIPFQSRGIRNHHDDIRLLMNNEIARNAFLIGIGRQAVGPWQINNAQARSVAGERAFLALDSLARPVAHMLAETRQKIKDG
jgi:hypothetical protein